MHLGARLGKLEVTADESSTTNRIQTFELLSTLVPFSIALGDTFSAPPVPLPPPIDIFFLCWSERLRSWTRSSSEDNFSSNFPKTKLPTYNSRRHPIMEHHPITSLPFHYTGYVTIESSTTDREAIPAQTHGYLRSSAQAKTRDLNPLFARGFPEQGHLELDSKMISFKVNGASMLVISAHKVGAGQPLLLFLTYLC